MCEQNLVAISIKAQHGCLATIGTGAQFAGRGGKSTVITLCGEQYPVSL